MSDEKAALRAFGKRLHKYRRDRGLTQVELAKKLKVSQRSVSSYELGVVWPSMPVLIRLIHILQVTIDDLVLGGKPSLAPPEMSVSRSRLWSRVKQIEGLSRVGQKAALDVLDAMIARYGGGNGTQGQ